MNNGLKLQRRIVRRVTLIALLVVTTTLSSRLRADVQTVGTCGGASINIPFTDVQGSNIFFCAIAEAYFAGLTNGTTATTYSPNDPVTREQMAAFISRTMDQSLKRSSPRAALGQWWTQQSIGQNAINQIGGSPRGVRSDGEDLWVASPGNAEVNRIRASDGKLIDIWSGLDARDVLIANGRVYVVGGSNPGHLYAIDPRQPGPNAVLLANVCNFPTSMAFDGEHLLIGGQNGVTNYHTPSASFITYNFSCEILGALYDGTSFWFADAFDNALKKFRVDGAILQTVGVGTTPFYPAFDGTNIWAPNRDGNSITVVRAATGAVVATLTGNGLNGPVAAAFDGERMLIANGNGNSVSLWRATDLTPMGSFPTGANTSPAGVCSDGRNFWITLSTAGQLARF